MKTTINLLFFILTSFVVKAQESALKGTAYDADSRNKLGLVFVNNLTQKEGEHSRQKGDFSVKAEIGDLVVFSCPGYLSDTLIVEDLTPKMVLLRPALIVLDQVIVTAQGKAQDLKEVYSSAYSSASTSILSKNGELSLYNAFSTQAKQKRAFQKFMDEELNQKVIDQKFNRQLVTDLTKIRGQLLEDFMSYYRPTYSQVAAMNEFELRSYIVNSYNEYIKLPAEARIYPSLPKTSFGGLR
ncbi:hypothetical protein Pedsa_0149 [Pseudopedobacter saltans DSM 12145]|uniref:DUF4369 domain-containing protein n=1 Tax=Pseudopedobacter saltans (strain ATCC 51119 / DSM 12145 / JCM 21818 / CCUG 39354 / LMG 10337 / NBRC 100064 / NCIMB 13643) TaxID=762903 RepID=F0SDK8_PSESL|nr:hypothetical protein [Pseudopedobacter saltans]ADY50735.1 hypothetical protein Pedsa_0149 [Pseudopedobacter saltans DSM 12145]